MLGAAGRLGHARLPMRLSRQARYAVTGAFDVAYNGHGRAVQVRVVGERQGIPRAFLEQIFQRLRKAGLVEGKRGPGGGYRLARPPERIDLRAIVEAVDGPLAAADATPAQRPRGAALSRGPDFLWPALAGELADVLASTTLADLCTQAARAGVPREAPPGYEYQI